MSEHYYSSKPLVESQEQRIEVELRKLNMKFDTDRGVFSKSQIDFGSQLLIEAIDLAGKQKLIDVGCGYGPIGITLARAEPGLQCTLLDVNQRALALAERNATLNGVQNIRIIESDLLGAINEVDYDVIVSNPPIRAGKKVVHELFEQSHHHLHKDGELWIVIQKKQGLDSAVKKLETLFDTVEEVTKKKGYRIIRAIKGS